MKEAEAHPKSPREQEIDSLRVKIEGVHKKKSELISRIKHLKYKFRYKSAESEAVTKLASMEKEGTKNIGYLRKRKERLEFRIATEAYSLQAEKDLIRQKNEVEEELQEALKSYRLRKKVQLVEADLADLKKKIDELDSQIKDSDKVMDDLYGNLRRLTSASRQYAPHQRRERGQQGQKPVEISLADIAIIKDKTNGNPGKKAGDGK